jgi:hypothetical protein
LPVAGRIFTVKAILLSVTFYRNQQKISFTEESQIMKTMVMLIAFWFMLTAVGTSGQASRHGYYVGKIGENLLVQMYFEIAAEGIEGSYYYESTGRPIQLTGKMGQDNAITLTEKDDKGAVTGRFEGRLAESDNVFTGQWLSPDNQKTLPFTLKKVAEYLTKTEKIAQKGMNAEVEGSYPKFIGSNALASAINRAAQQSVQKACDEFIQESGKTFKDESPDKDSLFMFQWHRGIHYSIVYYSEKLVSMLITFDEYTGGAHPNYYFSSETYWLQGENAVKAELKDLFKSDSAYVKTLSDYCMENLRKQEAGFIVDGTIKSLSADDFKVFTIEPKSIRFAFSPYHVGPYVQGDFSCRAPFKVVKNLINPNGPLASLIKD